MIMTVILEKGTTVRAYRGAFDQENAVTLATRGYVAFA